MLNCSRLDPGQCSTACLLHSVTRNLNSCFIMHSYEKTLCYFLILSAVTHRDLPHQEEQCLKLKFFVCKQVWIKWHLAILHVGIWLCLCNWSVGILGQAGYLVLWDKNSSLDIWFIQDTDAQGKMQVKIKAVHKNRPRNNVCVLPQCRCLLLSRLQFAQVENETAAQQRKFLPVAEGRATCCGTGSHHFLQWCFVTC